MSANFKFACGAECGVNAIGNAVIAGTERHIVTMGGATTVQTGGGKTAGSWSKRSWKFSSAGTTGDTLAHTFGTTISSPAVMVVRFRIMFDSLPTAIRSFISDPLGAGGIRYNPTGTKLEAWIGTASPVLAGSFVPSTGVWYQIDVRITRGTTATTEWQVDGSAQTTASKGSQTAGAIAGVNFGHNASGGSGSGVSGVSYYIDDICVSGATTTNTDYPMGNGRVVALFPDSDGAHSFTTGDFAWPTAANTKPSSATDAYLGFKQSTDGLTSTPSDFISQVVQRTGGYVELNFEAIPAPTAINGVMLVSQHHGSTVGGHGQTLRFMESTITEVVVLSNVNVATLTTSYASRAFPTRLGGSAWSESILNQMFARWGYSGDVIGNPIWDGICLEVDYNPVTTLTGSISPVVFTLTPVSISGSVVTDDPPNLQVDIVSDTASLSWDASPTPDVVDYSIFRRTPITGVDFDPDVDTPIATGIATLSYDDVGLSPATYEWQAFGRVFEGWTPELLPSLAGWYDASILASITQTAGKVSQWADLSGNARHLLQASSGEQPTTGIRTINGMNAIDFDYGDEMRTAAFAAFTGNTGLWWIVTTRDVVPAYKRYLMMTGGGGNEWSTDANIIPFNGANIDNWVSVQYNSRWYGNGSSMGMNVSQDNPHVMVLVRNGATMTHYLDSDTPLIDSSYSAANFAFTMLQVFAAGMEGCVGEVGWSTEATDPTELIAYLKEKWLPWTPAMLPDLEAWYDASNTASITDAGAGAVSQWNDLSGNGNHLTQGTSDARPTTGSHTINGLNTIYFNNATTQDYMQPSANFLSGAAGGTVICVVRLLTGGHGHGGIFDRFGATISDAQHIYSNDDRVYEDFGTTSRKDWPKGVWSNGTEAVYCVVSASSDFRAYLNGAAAYSTINNTVGWHASTPYVGRNIQGAETRHMDLAELIFCSSAIGDSDRQAVETYLKEKWGTPEPVWSPLDLPDLVSWYDASDTSSITASAGAVSQWNDKSGNGRHATQATGGNQPLTGVDTINGKNVLKFDGSNDSLHQNTAVSLNAPVTYLVVFKNTAVSLQRDILYTNNSDTRIYMMQNAGVERTFSMSAGGSNVPGPVLDTSSVYQSVSIYNGVSSALYVNGGSPITGNPGSNPTGTTAWTIGNTFSEPWQGDIAELVIIDSLITSEDRAAWNAYCAAKWGTP